MSAVMRAYGEEFDVDAFLVDARCQSALSSASATRNSWPVSRKDVATKAPVYMFR